MMPISSHSKEVKLTLGLKERGLGQREHENRKNNNDSLRWHPICRVVGRHYRRDREGKKR